MFEIPLYILLFAYFLFLAIFAAFSIINFYHIFVSGSFTFASFVISFFIFAISTLTLYFTWNLLIGVDWQTPVIIFDKSWIPNIFKINI